ncbi:hypothetical protein [Halalkalibacter okhensis]|uniref:Uncharacterized protein n=1 Tax=Halalkalibacter okhensis TaxID=333138 RepID=A0A0B0ILM8_9BACI|nr:hypothetical protein [Halalkalibacter okhensis]KHF40954.1 hypothetical protein LQ50_06080 [Halalkalibacter okhensis]
MVLFVSLLIGTMVLFVLVYKKPTSFSRKLQIQFICIAALLLLVTFLLYSLYSLYIAVLAFVGLFLFFSLILGKQLELEIGLKEEDWPQENAVSIAGAEKEDLVEEDSINLNQNNREAVLLTVDEEKDESFHELDSETDIVHYFEQQPKRIFEQVDDYDEEEESLSLLPRELKDTRDEDDLPIRIPMDDVEVDLNREALEDKHEKTLRTEEDNTNAEVMFNRHKLFEQLENDK